VNFSDLTCTPTGYYNNTIVDANSECYNLISNASVFNLNVEIKEYDFKIYTPTNFDFVFEMIIDNK
jgi:hypothetical protein